MSNFLSEQEKTISQKFEKNGFLIHKILDLKALEKIRNIFIEAIKKNVKMKFSNKSDSNILNQIHNNVSSKNLNSFRLKIIDQVNKNPNIRKLYYSLAKPYLDILIGNEISMQLRINLSIQLPNDKNSLLPLHSDVWSGDSPYEIVVWLPLVDCYKTKAMYILPPNKYFKIKKNLLDKKIKSSDQLFKKIKKDLQWIKIDYGNILLFNQCLPHGNIVNKEKETRWSLNCRFKGVFTPHRDKKIGEFFEPITLRKVSQLAQKYVLPNIK